MSTESHTLESNARVKTLRDWLILDSQIDDAGEILAAYAKSRFEVPGCVISILDEGGKWRHIESKFDGPIQPLEEKNLFRVIREDRGENACYFMSRAFGNDYFSMSGVLRNDSGAPIGVLTLFDKRMRFLDELECSHFNDVVKLLSKELA